MLNKFLESSTVVRYWNAIEELASRLSPHTVHRAYIACAERRARAKRKADSPVTIKVPDNAIWYVAKYGIMDAARDIRRFKALVFIKTPTDKDCG